MTIIESVLYMAQHGNSTVLEMFLIPYIPLLQ